jgi:outer membrane protein assembly factor BamB
MPSRLASTLVLQSALVVGVFFPAASAAADWPAWRGAGGQGHCQEKDLPLKWSTTDNVLWKVPLPAPGNSTPVIWGEKILLTQANKGGTIRSLICLDRRDGKQLWKQEIIYAEKERVWNDNYYCSASPATDGQRVVVSHGSAGMYCYDLGGKELWKRTDLGTFQHQYGNASSPVLYGDTVILWCGPNEGRGRNDLLAVDRATGKTRWEYKAPGGSWSTPLIVPGSEIAEGALKGIDQLILPIPHKLKGLDPKTGKELWSCDGLTNLVYTSPLYADGVAVAMSGYNGAALAVRLGGKGDITHDRLWHHPRNIQRVGSGVIVEDHVYILEENGVPHCYELTTGKEVWQISKRPGRSNSWSSMVYADGRLYVLTHNGDTNVFAASPKYELLATNTLGEHTNASVAISNGQLFIRTDKHLWCIGE